MNDIESAYKETHRVLKDGGMFCGCFCIKGEDKKTDWFIEKLYTPKGYFTPPFENKEKILRREK